MKANNKKYPEVLTEKESRRFWSKVNKNGPVVKQELGKCWEWTAGTFNGGYGSFSLRNKSVVAHRLSYTMAKGIVCDKLELDHLCRNTSCVNPEHLEPVTQTVNTLRGEAPSAKNASKTKCPRGHLLSSPNLRVWAKKMDKRSCVACDRAKSKYSNSKYRKGIELDPDLFQQISDEYYKEITKGAKINA